MSDQRSHSFPQPNGHVGGSSPGTAQPSPRHAQLGSPTGASSSRPARQNSLPEGTSSGRDSGLLWAQTEELFELIACSQSQRLDDQRASVSNFPELDLSLPSLGHRCGACSVQGPGEDFFDMLVKYQSSRIEDQRCTLPDPGGSDAGSEGHEDLFSLIQRVQARRMDEQRAPLHTDEAQASGTLPEAKPAPKPS
ncbi:G-protein-signaling modulator 1 [Hypomesus transpacificus]|uniref:G-protein-signaling modulator 1 n=1 Tax=Hypomesus transpacificus TaxID=137520 RepID=UPI001F084D5E|nr:G-protein-signaling modulator 1 [Hypomesus transpacificus]XP_046904535.1 G-protein-signaling modulator 1 [Hypomesus transpacificus]